MGALALSRRTSENIQGVQVCGVLRSLSANIATTMHERLGPVTRPSLVQHSNLRLSPSVSTKHVLIFRDSSPISPRSMRDTAMGFFVSASR